MAATTTEKCWGYCRNGDHEPWQAAHFRFDDEVLRVAPQQSGQPPVDVALADIVDVHELTIDLTGPPTVVFATRSGHRFEVLLEQRFTDGLCTALRRSTAGEATPHSPAGNGGPRPIAALTAPAEAVTFDARPPSAPTPPEVSAARLLAVRRRLGLKPVAVAAIAFALVAGLALNNWRVAGINSDRADQAEASLQSARSDLATSREDASKANSQLASTKSELNTALANVTRLERENVTLTDRISEVSNDKAQAQDERNAAAELARIGAEAGAKMLECRDRVLDALSYVLDEYYVSAAAALDAAKPTCQMANTLVAQLQSAIGG